MKKVIIISDIHNRTHIAEFIIKNESPDLVIFLGDYFDSFDDDGNPDLVRETAQWFSWSINQPNRIHIAGNHDVPYWFPKNRHLKCPGFNHFKFLLVDEFVSDQDWSKLVFHHNLDNKWILSHAGVHPFWYKSYQSSPVEIDHFLKRESEKFINEAYKGNSHWFAKWSRARSNTAHAGGLLWNDFNGDFHAIEGVNQIVGHTDRIRPRWIFKVPGCDKQQWYEKSYDMDVQYGKNISFNVCIDTENEHYALWDGNKLIIKTTQDIIPSKKT